MRKFVTILAALLVCGVVVQAAQDTDITNRELRDPLQLETWLQANATDAQTRLTAVEAGGVPGAVGGALASGKIVVGNSGGTGTAVTVSGSLRVSNTGSASIPNQAVALTNLASAVQTSLGNADTALQPTGNGASLTNLAIGQMAAITATAAEINAVANPSVAAPANATNTQVVTLDFTKSVQQLTAMNATTTVTLANVAAADVGKSIVLVNVGGTNALAITKTGNYYGTSAALDDDQSIVIYSTATNVLLSYGGQ